MRKNIALKKPLEGVDYDKLGIGPLRAEAVRPRPLGVTSSRRVGAINLEQLDVLLDSLKTYWDYTNQKSFLDEIKHPTVSTVSVENMLIYEL